MWIFLLGLYSVIGVVLVSSVIKGNSALLNYFVRTGWYFPVHMVISSYTVFLGALGKTVLEKSLILVMISAKIFLEEDNRKLKTKLLSNLKNEGSSGNKAPRILEIRQYRNVIYDYAEFSGRDVDFYPDKCEVIMVEPNKEFHPSLEQHIRTKPGLKLEGLYQAYGEDMQFIPSDSVDIVICLKVLCSVSDAQKVLKEIKRVLKADGKFYVLEHGTDLDDNVKWWVQKFFNFTKVYSYAMLGCCNRDIPHELRNAGFNPIRLEKGGFTKRFLPFSYVSTPIYFGAVTLD